MPAAHSVRPVTLAVRTEQQEERTSSLCACTLAPASLTPTPQVGFVAPTTTSSGSSSGSAADFSRLAGARWTLEYETGATGRGTKAALMCVLVLWLVGWLSWCYAVFLRRAVLGIEVRSCFFPNLCCLLCACLPACPLAHFVSWLRPLCLSNAESGHSRHATLTRHVRKPPLRHPTPHHTTT